MPKTRDRSILGRVASFGAPPLLNLLTPILVLPVLASATDTVGWAELAIAQSTGSLAAVLIAFGWNVAGPVEVARADAGRVRQIYTESLLTRLAVASPVLIAVIALSLARAPDDYVGLSVAVAVAAALQGLSPTWVAIGLGRARSIVLFETLPRVALLVVSAAFIVAGGSILLYPAALGASTLIGIALFSTRTVRPITIPGGWGKAFRTRLRQLSSMAAATTTASLYSSGALLLVGLAATSREAAEVASADRLFRIGLVAAVVLANALQAWVVHRDEGLARHRRRHALMLHAGLGAIGGLALAGATPKAAEVLFGAHLAPDHVVAALYGTTFAIQAVQLSLVQHFLIPAGRSRAVMLSTLSGAGLGVPLILVLTAHGGARGAAGALAISEAFVLVLFVATQASAARGGTRPVPQGSLSL